MNNYSVMYQLHNGVATTKVEADSMWCKERSVTFYAEGVEVAYYATVVEVVLIREGSK